MQDPQTRLIDDQVNCEPEPLGPDNPHAIGFCSKETDLTHELAAIRNVNVESSRIWKIKNEGVRNRLTGTTLLVLLPFALTACYCAGRLTATQPESGHCCRNPFATRQHGYHVL